jgi:hypothetical protein
MVLPHERFQGVYVVRAKEDALATKNFCPGESVYGEKRISVDVLFCFSSDDFIVGCVISQWKDRI